MNTERRARPTFGTSVFINCPFDSDYQPLYCALVFAVEACGFYVRCSLEVDDSGETRAEKLIRIIRGSRYGIHDISRTELNTNRPPRFNMPYEFGMFVGFKYSGHAEQAKKAVLVLDRERFRYQQFLSDIAGQDIRSHDNRPQTLIREVRHWLRSHSRVDLPGAEQLIREFEQFQSEMPRLLIRLQKTEADLENYRDFHTLVYNWLLVQRGARGRERGS
jgi:hypothetical protein